MAFALDGIIKQVFVWHDLLDAVLLELLLDKGQRADAYCLAARNHAAKKGPSSAMMTFPPQTSMRITRAAFASSAASMALSVNFEPKGNWRPCGCRAAPAFGKRSGLLGV